METGLRAHSRRILKPDARKFFAALIFLLRRAWTLWMCLFFWGYLLIVLTPLYHILFRIHRPWVHPLVHRLNVSCAWLTLTAGLVRLQTHFEVPIPKDKAFVFVANHRSYIDVAICHVALKYDFRFIGKAELNHVPLFGYMYSRLHLALNRTSKLASARVLKAAKGKLAEGTSIFIFPEGTTQHKAGTLLGPLKEGAFHLAISAQVPVVPVTIIGSARALSADGQFLSSPAVVDVVLNAPIETKGLRMADAAALSEQIRSTFEQNLLHHARNS